MPMVWVLLVGLALRGRGVVGLFTWTLGSALVRAVVGANVSPAAGSWSQIIFTGTLFVWAIRRPTESEAKLGFLRALRLLIALCMIATGLIGLLMLAIHGFRFSGSGAPVWLPLGTSAICGSILFAFKKWLVLNERRKKST
ncbi:hypothetical protein KX816_18425 [Sphingosinicellaceae bacterium]|nr:hypothetical protein KX816_18425 [Sphingosinicellaceae bacterium]